MTEHIANLDGLMGKLVTFDKYDKDGVCVGRVTGDVRGWYFGGSGVAGGVPMLAVEAVGCFYTVALTSVRTLEPEPA